MKPVLLIREQNVTLPLEDSYRAVCTIIDRASPPVHMSCDFLRDPLAFRVAIFPLAIYRKMEELKHGNRASS